MVEHGLDIHETLVSLPSIVCLCASHVLRSVSSVTGLVCMLLKTGLCQLLLINVLYFKETLALALRLDIFILSEKLRKPLFLTMVKNSSPDSRYYLQVAFG